MAYTLHCSAHLLLRHAPEGAVQVPHFSLKRPAPMDCKSHYPSLLRLRRVLGEPEKPPHVPGTTIHATVFPRGSPKHLRTVSALRSGTLQCRAYYGLPHDARAFPGPRRAFRWLELTPQIRVRYPEPRLKGGFSWNFYLTLHLWRHVFNPNMFHLVLRGIPHEREGE